MLDQIRQKLIVWLIKKVQRYGAHTVEVLGRTYVISGDVFNPKYYFTSKFMARHIRVQPDDVILDMGTGSGIQAITAGQTASEVVAVDINPEAVRYARKNIEAHGLEDVVTVIEGDLFRYVSPNHKFNVILFTPPYLEGVTRTDLDHALYDRDKNLLGRFFSEAADYLAPRGYVQMLYSSIAGHERALGIAESYGWHHREVACEETFTEKFLIYKLTRD